MSDTIRGIGIGYHGHLNWCIAAEEPGAGCWDEGYEKVPTLEDVCSAIEEDPGAYGYVVIEPVMLDLSDKHVDLLRRLRDLCSEHDIVLIFDEVITGFRTPNYCMANYLGIQPDLMCLGKACANGAPLAIVGGKREIMDTPDWFVSSTFAGESHAIDEALYVLDVVDEDRLQQLWERGAWFQKEFNGITPNIQLVGIPTKNVFVGEDTYVAIFWQEMVKRGHIFNKAHHIMFAHTVEILGDALHHAREVVAMIESGAAGLEADLPQPVFQRHG